MTFEISQPLRREHEDLHSTVLRATKEPGTLGEAARRVERLFQSHFSKEESCTLPAVSVLADVARGRITPEMQNIVALGERLQNELDNMLAEHRMIEAAIEDMMAIAGRENKDDYAELGIRFITHAQTEELLTYPAVIVLANYPKIRLGIHP